MHSQIRSQLHLLHDRPSAHMDQRIRWSIPRDPIIHGILGSLQHPVSNDLKHPNLQTYDEQHGQNRLSNHWSGKPFRPDSNNSSSGMWPRQSTAELL